MKIGDIIIDYKLKSGVETRIIHNEHYYKCIGIVCSERESESRWCLYYDHFEGYKSRNLLNKYLIHIKKPSSSNLKMIFEIYDKIFNDSSDEKLRYWSPLKITNNELLYKLKSRYLEYKQLERQYKLERITTNENMLD